MTVASETNRSGPYSGNGVTTVFAYGFRIVDQSHLQVIRTDATGAETTLALLTDYTVSGVGSAGGGSITLTTALPSGSTVTILRNIPFTQETDLENQGAYYAQTVEDALDLAVMRDQTLLALAQNAIRAPDTETVQMVLPSAGLRANKYLIFDANGQPTYVDSQIDARYYGALSADPETRPDGSARQAGDAYFNSITLSFRVFSGSGWQNAIPPAALTLVNFTEVAASAKTTFTISGGYTAGTTFAYLNGVLLAPDEVTMANGTTAVLSSACAIGDEFRLVGFSPFSVADTLARSNNLGDLPSVTAALANLGFSTYVQSLRAAASAAAFRTALGLQFGATAALASQAAAEAGTNNTDLMTALRVAQAVAALAPAQVTTARVLSATAGAAAGGIGTYVFARTAVTSVNFGDTTSGSNLFPAAITVGGNDQTSGTALSGTWRCMGIKTSSANSITVWLRIS